MGKVGTNHLAKSTEALSTKMLPEKWHHETCYGTLEEFTWFFSIIQFQRGQCHWKNMVRCEQEYF